MFNLLPYYLYTKRKLILLATIFTIILANTGCQHIYQKHIGNEAIHNMWLKAKQKEAKENKQNKVDTKKSVR